MTEKLYYQDPDLLDFEARLLRLEQDEARWRAVLDRTAFYPEGGGHPPDQGTLNEIPVVDVQEIDGEVVHFVAGPLQGSEGPGSEPARITGRVARAHRREFMQQHTGQHLVSAALVEAADAATISAHLGEEHVTVEVDRESFGVAELEAAETLANRMVTQNLTVRIHWVDREELGRFQLRKAPPPGLERLRLVEIPGHDISACGGLHVGSTGEVGLIHLAGMERIRGRLRLAFRVGERAYRAARDNERLLQEVGRELSCGREELPAAVSVLKARLRGKEQEAAQLKGRLGQLLASGLRNQARHAGGLALVLHRADERDPELERDPGLFEAVFRELVSIPGTVAVLLRGEGAGLRWLAGCSPELDLDLGSAVLPHLELIDGRGGGRGGRWQGVGKRIEGAELFSTAVEAALLHSIGSSKKPRHENGHAT